VGTHDETPVQLRWRLADDDSGQQSLFDEERSEWRAGHGEFRGLEFLHVRARRVINQVPASSRMSFRYTINAYRGCSHACTYCLQGDTPVLMGDGRTKPLAEVRVGDAVYGTIRQGAYRRYVVTEVLDHWSTVKPAYRLRLHDGTAFVAGGDHRFLTDRGWKYVTGSEHGGSRRPHITASNKLMGTGHFSPPPERGPEYRRGYGCGLIRAVALATETVASADVAPPEWCKGFLAGIFDAEGSYSRGVLRIASTEPAIIECIEACLRRFDFPFAVQPTGGRKGLVYIRLLGGLRQQLRFFHTVDPAVTRKRTFEGTALKSQTAGLRVESVEPLGLELPLYDLTTGTGDFIANGVVSHNCFARPTHEYLNLNAGEDFERRIVVKINAVERVRAELASKRWAGDLIAMGTNTDPYQRCEGKYRLTRGIVEALSDAGNPFSVLTKSTLILRDLDVLAEAARRTEVRAALSIGTLDEEVWRSSEPGTPHPRQRLEAVARLNAAGIPTSVLVAPILPGLSDAPEQLAAIARAAAEAGAVSITPIVLHLRSGVREEYLGWLAEYYPELMVEYERLYRRAYAPKAFQKEVLARFRAGDQAAGVEPNMNIGENS
jgi:DNA repair photolyase